MRYFKNGLEGTREEAAEEIGEQRLSDRERQAEEEWAEDPLTLMTWMDRFEITR